VSTGRQADVWVRRLVATCLAIAAFAATAIGLVALGRTIDLPNEADGLTPASGGAGAAAHELLGHNHPTDFLIDYASADALRDGVDAYAISADLTARVDVPWAVSTANPHPPTLLTLVLPLTALRYDHALAVWALGMAVLYGCTLRLVGVPLPWAIVGAFALTFTFPGAYGIGNPVPVIGFGGAVAWRWRTVPAIAGIGVALAAAPKVSGLVLLVPFVLAGRWRVAAWALAVLAVLAVVPLLFDSGVWSAYLDLGVDAARLTAARSDNAAIVHRAVGWGVPEVASMAVLGVVAGALAVWRRDAFWPAIWLTVAALPIAWAYSALTLVPVMAFVARRRSPWAPPVVAVAAAAMVGSSPAGMWPTWIVPFIVALVAVALVLDRTDGPSDLWLHPRVIALLPGRVRPLVADRPGDAPVTEPVGEPARV
jgi:hypothetical protein